MAATIEDYTNVVMMGDAVDQAIRHRPVYGPYFNVLVEEFLARHKAVIWHRNGNMYTVDAVRSKSFSVSLAAYTEESQFIQGRPMEINHHFTVWAQGVPCTFDDIEKALDLFLRLLSKQARLVLHYFGDTVYGGELQLNQSMARSKENWATVAETTNSMSWLQNAFRRAGFLKKRTKVFSNNIISTHFLSEIPFYLRMGK